MERISEKELAGFSCTLNQNEVRQHTKGTLPLNCSIGTYLQEESIYQHVFSFYLNTGDFINI